MAEQSDRPESPNRDRWCWLALFLFALLVRGVYLAQIHDSPLFSALVVDASVYDKWAQEIAGGEWLGREVFYQAPLYPYFLAVNYAVFGHDLLAVRIVQILIGSASCVLLALAGRYWFSFRVGIIAGIMLAVYPVALFFDTIIQKSVLDLFFMTLLLFLVGRLASSPSGSGWLGCGMVLGLLSLTRENALLLLPLLFLWLGIRFRSELPMCRLRWSVLLLAGMALILVPVGLRNRIVGGEFFITTAQFGPNFYIGNHAQADGQYVPLRWGRCSPEFERLDATQLAETERGRRLSAREVSRHWTGKAWEYIRSEPVAWVGLLWKKWCLTWNAAEIVDAEDAGTYSRYSWILRFLAGCFHFGVLCPLAVVGVVATWSERRRLWVLYATTLAMALSVTVFYVFARYRFPLVPPLVLFAAAGTAAIIHSLQRKEYRRLVRIGTWGIISAVFVNLPLVSSATARATTEYNLGRTLQEQGRLVEAMQHYEAAIRLKADFVMAHFNLATTLTAMTNLPAASEQYRIALGLKPDYADAHNNLAGLLDEMGESDTAIQHYQQALQIDPKQPSVHFNMAVVLTKLGRREQALAHYQEALQLAPDYIQAHVNIAILLEQLGLPQQATEHYRQALRIDPTSPVTLFNFALLLESQGRRAEAIHHYQAALRAQPDFAPAKRKLDFLLTQEPETNRPPKTSP